MSKKSKKPKRYRIQYQTIYVYLPFNPRKGICDACGKSVTKGEIKSTAMHHYVYAYKPSTVKKNPPLALENTLELCFYDHRIADGIRSLYNANADRVASVLIVHPKEYRDGFIQLVKLMRYQKPIPINSRLRKIRR